MTIKQGIKNKVIELFKSGLGRNEIAQQMNGEISSGSVSNIISAWKAENNRNHITDSQPSLNTGVSLDKKASSPFSNAPTQSNGEGQAATNITSPNSPTLAEPTFISETQIEDIDFSDTSYEESYPNIPDADIVSRDVTKKDAPTEEKKFEQHQSEPSLRDSENPSIDLNINWDSDDSYQKRFWARVVAEKKQLKRERSILEIEKEQHELEIIRLVSEDEKQFRSNIEKFDGCSHCNSIISDDTYNNNKTTTATARHLRYLHAYNERLERRLGSITQTLRRIRPFPSQPCHTTKARI